MGDKMRAKRKRTKADYYEKYDDYEGYEDYEKPRKKRKKFNPVKTFFKIVISIVAAFLVLSGGAAFAYYKVTGENPFGNVAVTNASDMNFLDALLKRNIKMNVAVFGTDKDGARTDVMFVVHYDSAQESLDLVSLPRDTRVSVCDEVVANYKAGGHPYNQVTKLNAIHSYSAGDQCCENTVLQIEDLLGISIDHYIKIDLEAFRKIVDAVGGVEVDVPQDMDYEDPAQDLYIHLDAGLQTLNGDQAEQLVRYRRYPTGDEGRIEVQQLFLRALAEKVLSSETILKNLPDYIDVLYKDVKTDISLTDALKYANYIEKIDMNKITMQTIPGGGQYIGGVSYFVHDAAGTAELVDQVFYQEHSSDAGSEGSTSSKGKVIEVSNGGNVNGLAGRFTEKLKEDGYQLTDPTTYSGEQTSYTRIQVKSQGMGEDLIPYFAEAKVEVAPDLLAEGTDIRIILGTKES